MELLLPSGNQLNQLEMFQKRLLKQILSLPANVADVTIYILTGILPIEAQIHARALSFFNNICHQAENSTEKVLARRQLALKSNSSSSWFIELKQILRKYNLNEPIEYLNRPIKKSTWSNITRKCIHEFWSKAILEIVPLYTGLDHLSSYNLGKGKIHPLLKVNCQSTSDIMRLPIKLKILTGSYTLQTKRVRMYQKEEDPTCLLCNSNKENIEHVVLTCKNLSGTRDPILLELDNYLSNCNIIFGSLTRHSQLQIIMVATSL